MKKGPSRTGPPRRINATSCLRLSSPLQLVWRGAGVTLLRDDLVPQHPDLRRAHLNRFTHAQEQLVRLETAALYARRLVHRRTLARAGRNHVAGPECDVARHVLQVLGKRER